jgi:hypothetical protein
MPRVLTEAEKRRRAGFQQNFQNTVGTTAQGNRTQQASTVATAQRNSNNAIQGRTQQQQQAQAQQAQRNPRLEGHPANARFVSRDGRVSYNAQGQRLDSNGNVAFRTSRSRRRGGSASDERTSGLTSATDGTTAASEAQNAVLQLPWLAFAQQQAANNNTGVATNQNAAAQAQTQQQAIANTGFTPATVNPGSFANLAIPAPTANPQVWQGLTPQQQQAALNYYNSVLPFAQLNQNAFQYQNDFVEAQRRFQLELAQRQREAAFNAAGRASLPNRL